jgi:hypothetical protein
MSTPADDLRPLPVEGLLWRGPEWEVMERGAADQGEGREFWWDPIHGWVKHQGPIVQVTIPPDYSKPY